MRNKFYAVLLVMCILFAFACKKSSTNGTQDTPTNKPKKYLTHTIIVSTTPGAGGTSTTSTSNVYYTYDGQKRLSSMKNGDNLTAYAYYDNGELYTITNTNSTSPNRSITEFTYADGRLKLYTLRVYKSNVLDSETPYNYVYDGNRVSEIHWEIYYAKFTYDGSGNIVKIFHYGDPQYYTVFTYDDKKNTLFNSLAKYPTVADVSRFSLNNTTSFTTEDLNQNILVNYRYNYDDEGYPTSMAMTASASAVTSKYTYEYSTLD